MAARLVGWENDPTVYDRERGRIIRALRADRWRDRSFRRGGFEDLARWALLGRSKGDGESVVVMAPTPSGRRPSVLKRSTVEWLHAEGLADALQREVLQGAPLIGPLDELRPALGRFMVEHDAPRR